MPFVDITLMFAELHAVYQSLLSGPLVIINGEVTPELYSVTQGVMLKVTGVGLAIVLLVGVSATLALASQFPYFRSHRHNSLFR